MSVEYYRKRLIDLRADVAKEREAKKKGFFARLFGK